LDKNECLTQTVTMNHHATISNQQCKCMVNVVQRKKLRKEKLSSKCVYISDPSTRKCLDDIPKKHTRDTFRTTTVDFNHLQSSDMDVCPAQRPQTQAPPQNQPRYRRLARAAKFLASTLNEREQSSADADCCNWELEELDGQDTRQCTQVQHQL